MGLFPLGFAFPLQENHGLALLSSLGDPLGTTWDLLGVEKRLILNSLGLLGHSGSSLGSLLELLGSLLELLGSLLELLRSLL